MKKILFNLAMIDTLTYCKNHNIDASGSHLYKYPRRWTYVLLRTETGRSLVIVTYYKNRIPSYVVDPELK